MSEQCGEYITAIEVDREIVTKSITELIATIDKEIEIEWETLDVIIKKPSEGYSPFDMIISEEPGEEGKLIKFWTIGVKARGTRKNEG